MKLIQRRAQGSAFSREPMTLLLFSKSQQKTEELGEIYNRNKTQAKSFAPRFTDLTT